MESKAGSDFRPRVAGSSSDHCLDFGTKRHYQATIGPLQATVPEFAQLSVEQWAAKQDLGIDAASSVNEGHLAVEKQMRDIGAELYLEVQQYLGEELDVERKAALRRINWVYYADGELEIHMAISTQSM
ncbi:hypothetical protein PMIN05_003859 [Paraphaeosphaeria minitans]